MTTPRTTYSQNDLDRMAHLRAMKDTLNAPDSLSSSKYLLVFDNKIVLKEENKNTCYFSKFEIDSLLSNNDIEIFLGSRNNECYFAIAINKMPENLYYLKGLKELAQSSLLRDEDLGVIAQAASTINWHKSHKFCSNCGSMTELTDYGWRRDCSKCKRQHFPRTDPVVIMLVLLR